MDIAVLAAKARHHWGIWLPRKTAELVALKTLDEATHVAAAQAHQWINQLMASGYRVHEAEEVALREFILLPAEPSADDDWETIELAEMEAEYQERMKGHE